MRRISWTRLIVVWLLLFLVGCGSQAVSEMSRPTPEQPSPMPISSIADLQQPEGKNPNVYLKGKVGDRVPILQGTVYELQDATGKVWVLTQAPAPQAGDEVTVKGVVRFKSIVLDGKEQGSIYVEQQGIEN